MKKERDWYDIELERQEYERKQMANMTPEEREEYQHMIGVAVERKPVLVGLSFTALDKANAEITALREIIRTLRQFFVDRGCCCSGGLDKHFCLGCEVIGMIDAGLAKIGEERDGG